MWISILNTVNFGYKHFDACEHWIRNHFFSVQWSYICRISRTRSWVCTRCTPIIQERGKYDKKEEAKESSNWFGTFPVTCQFCILQASIINKGEYETYYQKKKRRIWNSTHMEIFLTLGMRFLELGFLRVPYIWDCTRFLLFHFSASSALMAVFVPYRSEVPRLRH